MIQANSLDPDKARNSDRYFFKSEDDKKNAKITQHAELIYMYVDINTVFAIR